ncbi:tetratricopeptide repeat protein [Pseudoalteromonas rubra]|uniref:tetratricopeptide repeat protein n=1 Tax=Pseudoalteromonas rubra TaxID=43658 RepID=UPI002DBE2B50|nr:tetratricopeptide repeat protein [Pseudoalteromonas rubra]MEC4091316.1 tetratricopeptide repeat protein [Pseudoalteromonas rubra]
MDKLTAGLFTSHDLITRFLIRFKNALLVATVLSVIGYFWLQHAQQTAQFQRLLLEPKTDDLILVDLGRFDTQRVYQAQYRITQVVATTDNIITVKQGRYTYGRKRDVKRAIQLDNLMLDNYFDATPLQWPRTELAHYFEQGAIYAIHRPNDIYVMGGIVKPRVIPRLHTPTAKHRLSPDNQRGIAHYQMGELQQAREAFALSAQQADHWGQYNLATMLLGGEGGEADPKRAIELLRQAATKGNPKAQTLLSELCPGNKACD